MRDAKGLETLDHMTYVASVPDGETILHMASTGERLFVATDKHIYVLSDDKRLELIN